MFYVTRNTPQQHPFYNVRKEAEKYIIEVSLAGYKPEAVTVRHDTQQRIDLYNGDLYTILEVVAEKTKEEKEYLIRGIAGRNAKIGWRLYAGWQVLTTTFENGILTIVLDTTEAKGAIKEFTF